MKIRKIIKVMMAFLLSVITVCVIFVFVSAFITSKHFSVQGVLNRVIQTFLYIIGYEDLRTGNVLLRCILAITGLFSLSFLSAYLTVLFLYRTDVKIVPKILVFKKNGDYHCSVSIRNNGYDICNVRLSINLYNNAGEKIIKESYEKTNPIIPRKSVWKQDFCISSVHNPFFYDVFLNFLNLKEDCVLYILWSFIDDITGQETVHIQSYRYTDCVFSNFLTPKRSFLRKCPSSTVLMNSFEEWMQSEYRLLPLENAIAINDSALLCNYMPQKNALSMNIDYSDWNSEHISPETFVMASIQFRTPENWCSFFNRKWFLQFELFGDASKVKRIRLEVKKKERLEVIISKSFDIVDAIDGKGVVYNVPLNNIGLSAQSFEEIKEVDFTVFVCDMVKSIHPKGTIVIRNCKLVSPVT